MENPDVPADDHPIPENDPLGMGQPQSSLDRGKRTNVDGISAIEFVEVPSELPCHKPSLDQYL